MIVYRQVLVDVEVDAVPLSTPGGGIEQTAKLGPLFMVGLRWATP